MKKFCSVAIALVMALTVFIVPNLGMVYAGDQEAVEPDGTTVSDEVMAAGDGATPDGDNPSDIDPEPAQLAAPVVTVSSSKEGIVFSWEAIGDADGYKCYEDGEGWTDLGKDTTSYKLKRKGVTLKVYAYKGTENSAVTECELKAPAAPTFTSATAGYNNIQFTWSAVEGADGYAYSRFSISDPIGDNEFRDNGTSTSFNWTDLPQRANRTFYLCAYLEVPDETVGAVKRNPDDVYVLLSPVASKNATTASSERIVKTPISKGGIYRYYNDSIAKGKDLGTCYGMYKTVQGKSSKTKYLIALDTKRNNVVVYKGKKGKWVVCKHFICATGKEGHRTPRGSFKVKKRKPKFASGDKVDGVLVKAKWTCWYATQFSGACFFHSVLYHLNSKTKTADRKVGDYRSHGCVRLYMGDAKWIYKNCKKGTTVLSYNYSPNYTYGN